MSDVIAFARVLMITPLANYEGEIVATSKFLQFIPSTDPDQGRLSLAYHRWPRL
jgi:hypothetical protein